MIGQFNQWLSILVFWIKIIYISAESKWLKCLIALLKFRADQSFANDGHSPFVRQWHRQVNDKATNGCIATLYSYSSIYKSDRICDGCHGLYYSVTCTRDNWYRFTLRQFSAEIYRIELLRRTGLPRTNTSSSPHFTWMLIRLTRHHASKVYESQTRRKRRKILSESENKNKTALMRINKSRIVQTNDSIIDRWTEEMD